MNFSKGNPFKKLLRLLKDRQCDLLKINSKLNLKV